MERIDLGAQQQRAPAPQFMPDQRPTADAAAIARNPRPDVPLAVAAVTSPVPAQNLSQTVEISKSMLRADSASPTDPALPLDKRLNGIDRTLKPYGVSMLPDTEAAQRAKAAARRADAAEAAATRARAEADAAQTASDTGKTEDADARRQAQTAAPDPAPALSPAAPEVARPAPDTATAAPVRSEKAPSPDAAAP